MNHIRTQTLSFPRTPLLIVAAVALAFAAWMTWAPAATAQEEDTETIELQPGWNLKGWLGPSGTDIADAIENNQGSEGDLSGLVTALWTWDGSEQEWNAFFPESDFPGANDFDEFERGGSYFISYAGDSGTNWVIPIN